MSKLGDFLEVVHGPAIRFRTVRAVISQWQNQTLADRALAYAVDKNRVPSTSALVEGAQTQMCATRISVWLSGANRIRADRSRSRGLGVENTLVIVNGDHWWERDLQGHVQVGGPGQGRACPNLPEVRRHFSPAYLRECFVSLLLESLGPVEVAGREFVRVRATPQPDSLWPHWLPTGADEYELHADPELGIVTFIAGKFRGEVFETNTVQEVTFDEDFDAALFHYEPRSGEQVMPAQPVVEWLTLAAATKRMPFRVLVPTWLPDPDHATFEVLFHHPPLGSGEDAHLQFLYHSLGLSLRQGSTSIFHPENREWQSVEHKGRQMTISDTGTGRRFIRLEHLGTCVEIWANLDRDQLTRVAASLTPAD